MPVTINASTSSGLVQSADNSGTVEIQSNGTTKLTVGSTGVNIGQYNPSASLITSGTAVNSTSGTSIDFTSIPSWVKRITVMFNGVSTNGTSYVLVRFGTSSGIESSGYVSGSSNTNGTSAQDTSGFIICANANAGNELRGSCIFSNFGSNGWSEQGSVYFQNTGGNGASSFNSGFKTLAGTLTTVRITTVNGTDTFDAGSINILYE